MPRMDGKGPFGTGPIGRRLGPCGGRPLGFGRRGRFWAEVVTDPTSFPNYPSETLEQQKARLEEQLKSVNQQLGEKKENQ